MIDVLMPLNFMLSHVKIEFCFTSNSSLQFPNPSCNASNYRRISTVLSPPNPEAMIR